MEEPKVKKNSKWLMILLGLLGVVIIVLIVAIITINNNLGNSGDVGGGLQALEINDDITDKIYGDEDYSAVNEATNIVRGKADFFGKMLEKCWKTCSRSHLF